MATKIIYEDRSKYTNRPTFRTPRYGNLLSDTFQGEVHFNGDAWSGWFMNLSDSNSYAYPTEFRFDFRSKGAATRWVNNKLRRVLK